MRFVLAQPANTGPTNPTARAASPAHPTNPNTQPDRPPADHTHDQNIADHPLVKHAAAIFDARITRIELRDDTA